MNHIKARSYLVTGVALLLVGLLLGQSMLLPSATSVAFAQQQSSDQNVNQRTVSVTGSSQVRVQLDQATVSVGVQTSATDAATALSANNDQMQSLLDALQSAGIPSEDIQTQTIQLQPQYSSTPQEMMPQSMTSPEVGSRAEVTGTSTITTPTAVPTVTETPTPGVFTEGPQITGYIATNTVNVRTTDLANLGTLLDTIVSAGSNQISGIQFDITDANTALTQARDAAWQDAQQKAEQLASLAGAQLGNVLTISEFSRGPVPLAQTSMAARDVSAVPIQPGTQDVGVDLQVTWQLQ